MSIVVATAVVAMLLPAVFMLGCTMPMTKALCGNISQNAGAVFSQGCDGIVFATEGPAAVASAGLSTLLFALALALVGATSMLFQVSSRPALLPALAEPPPPPESPLGVRLTL